MCHAEGFYAQIASISVPIHGGAPLEVSWVVARMRVLTALLCTKLGPELGPCSLALRGRILLGEVHSQRRRMYNCLNVWEWCLRNGIKVQQTTPTPCLLRWKLQEFRQTRKPCSSSAEYGVQIPISNGCILHVKTEFGHCIGTGITASVTTNMFIAL